MFIYYDYLLTSNQKRVSSHIYKFNNTVGACMINNGWRKLKIQMVQRINVYLPKFVTRLFSIA